MQFLATLAPQDYLDGLLRSRGYSTTRYRSTETGYYNKATPLQIASYGSHIVNILRKGDDANLRRYLRSGLAYNPSNLYGESLIHVACRLQRPGDNRLLINTMIEYGADVRIADDKGRTPLHDACWTYKPCFELIKTLLKHDSHLLMITDVRDCLPLSYAPRESWHDWLQFLQANKDTLWPSLMTKQTQNAGLSNPSSHRPSQVPPLTLQKPNSRPAEDPVHALSLKIAEMVSIGKLEPEEAMFLSTIDAIEDMDESYSDDDDDSDDDDSENSEEYAE